MERDAEREERYCVDKYYSRKIVKMTNEEGTFNRLLSELDAMSQQYGVHIEEIHKIFTDVSCSKSKLVEILQGNSFTKWNELEDLALQRGTESREYTYLLKSKGADEILRRKKFLGI